MTKKGKAKPRYCDYCESEMIFQDDHWQCICEDCVVKATKLFKAKGIFSSILGGWILNAPKGYFFQLPNGQRVMQIHLKSARRALKDEAYLKWVHQNDTKEKR